MKRIISLSIEGNTLRTLSFDRGYIERWDSIPFNPQFLRVGHVAESQKLSEVLHTVLADWDLSKSIVVCAFPGLRTMSRIISVPKVAKKEMDTVISREARRVMAISTEDNYFHWQLLPAQGERQQAFALAVPKEPLHAMLQALQGAGIMPYAIELKPIALARAVNQKDAIIANGENNSVELVIVINDVPTLMRSVFLGEGVVSEDYAIGRISDELVRTINFYNESNPDSPLDAGVPVFLTGAAASGMTFAMNVAALTGRPVQPPESPVPYPRDFPIADFMVNLGLILRYV